MGNTYELTSTKKTPSIIFNKDLGRLDIKGNSLPDNAVEFYSELEQNIFDYLNKPADETQLNIFIEYMNTSSSKAIFQLIAHFEKINDMGKSIEFNWYVEEGDSDMLDIGKDYEQSLKISTNIIEVDE